MHQRRTFVLLLAAAASMWLQTALAALPAIVTPSPVAPGFPDNCQSFIFIRPGDTCYSLPVTHQISMDDFLRANPVLQGPNDCTSKLYANFWYCRETTDAEAVLTTVIVTAFVTASADVSPTEASSTITTGLPPPPPVFTTTASPATFTPPSSPPHSTSCDVHNGCFRAFAGVHPLLAPAQSSWCQSVLNNPNPTAGWGDYGSTAPFMVTSVCPTVFHTAAAGDVVTSYCACMTAGQFGDLAHPTARGGAQKREARAVSSWRG